MPTPRSKTARLVLVCPECREAHGGTARIGNRKSSCRTCNRFGQAVRRAAARLLAAEHPADAERLRLEAEERVYAEMGLAAPEPASLNGAGTPVDLEVGTGSLPVGSTEQARPREEQTP